MGNIEFSVIVPLYNEQDNVHLLYETIISAAEPLGLPFEIVMVDDGSRDETFPRTEEIARSDPRVRVVKFRRNYGQTAAMAAGIEYANGKILITMDGDLQNDPADIPNFIEELRKGYDIVVGWRHRRQDKFLTRVLPSMIANWLIGKVTGVPIKDNGCSLKAFRADMIKNIPLYSELHRFIPAMTSLAGARLSQIKVRHHPRRFGKSKYGLSRIYRVLFDLLAVKTILTFAQRPLWWFSGMATGAGFLGLILFLYGFVWKWEVTGSPSVIFVGLSILFGALSVFMISLGVFGQLLYRTGFVRLEAFSRLSAMVDADLQDQEVTP